MKYVLIVILLGLGGIIAATYVGESAGPAPGPVPQADEPGSPPVDPDVAGPETGDDPKGTDVPEPDYGPAVEVPQDLLQKGLADIITDLVTGRAGRGDRDDLSRRLVLILEEERLGDTFKRTETADAVIDGLLVEIEKAAPRGAAGAAVTGQMKQYISSQARNVAKQIRSRLSKDAAGQQHQGFMMQAVAFDAPEGYEKVRWATLGGFEYQEGMTLPAAVMDLHGQDVAIAGYMITLGEVEDIHEFLLVESGWSCCFGVPPDVNQVIEVRIPQDQRGVEFTTTPVVVLGTIDVGEEVEDGFVISVYRIEAREVRDAE